MPSVITLHESSTNTERELYFDFYHTIIYCLLALKLLIFMQILGLLHNASKGSVLTKFYTDTWPRFSAVVCELITPKVWYEYQESGLHGLSSILTH